MFGAWGFVTAFYVSKLNDISLVFSFFAGKRNIEWGDIAEWFVHIFMRKLWGLVCLHKVPVLNNSVYQKKYTIWHSLFEKMHLNFYLDFNTKTFKEGVFIFN